MATPLRQVYGFVSQSVTPFNVALPWQSSVQDGLFKMNYSLKDAVFDDLKMWANTNRGERPFRRDFGLDARTVLFEQGPVAKEVLENRTRDQMRKYFRYLKIKRIQAVTENEDKALAANTIRLVLEFSLAENEQESFTFDKIVGA